MDTTSLLTRNARPIGLDAFTLVCDHAGVWFDRLELAARLKWTPRRMRSAIIDLAMAHLLLVAVDEAGKPALYAIPDH